MWGLPSQWSSFFYTHILLLDGRNQIPFSWAMDQVNPSLASVWEAMYYVLVHIWGLAASIQCPALRQTLPGSHPRLDHVLFLCVPTAHLSAKDVCKGKYLLAQCHLLLFCSPHCAGKPASGVWTSLASLWILCTICWCCVPFSWSGVCSPD